MSNEPPAVDGSAGTRIPVRPKLLDRATVVWHRAKFVLQLASEAPAVFTVLAAGWSAVHGEHDAGSRALAAAELLTGGWVLVLIAFEARHLFGRHTAHARAGHAPPAASHESPRIDVPNLAAAALGYVEAWHHTRTAGYFKLGSPYVVGATISLLMAVSKRRLQKTKRARPNRFYLDITPSGITYVAGPRTSWRADWTEVAAVEHDRDDVAVRLHDGRRRPLRAAAHADADALLAAARAAIAAHAPPQVPGVVDGASLGSPTPQP